MLMHIGRADDVTVERLHTRIAYFRNVGRALGQLE